jgi:hypothetical protein
MGEVRDMHTLDGNVIDERYILDFNIVEGPLAEELNFGGPASYGDEFILFFEDVIICLFVGDVDGWFFNVGHDCYYLMVLFDAEDDALDGS